MPAPRQNNRCRRGHLMDGHNIKRVPSSKYVSCRQCGRDAQKRRREKTMRKVTAEPHGKGLIIRFEKYHTITGDLGAETIKVASMALMELAAGFSLYDISVAIHEGLKP